MLVNRLSIIDKKTENEFSDAHDFIWGWSPNLQHWSCRTLSVIFKNYNILKLSDQLYRQINGVGIGVKQQQANSFLEKKFKKRSDFNRQETTELALETLQQALGMDIKSEEVEVIVVSEQRKQVTMLENEEIEGHLNSIAERD